MAARSPKKNRYRSKAARNARRPSGALVRSTGRLFLWLAAISIMSGLFVFGHDFLVQCAYFNATKIDVSGNRHISREEVLDILELEKGVNILSVNLPVSRKRLLAQPWVRDVEISREIPSRIIIRVTEHTPMALVALGQGYLINTEGLIFKKAEETDKKAYPLISGLEITDFRESGKAKSTAFEAALEVLQMGRRPDSILPNRVIGEIRVDREIGVTVRTKGPGRVIHLGYRDYDRKYKHLEQVLDYIATRPGLTGIDSFDLKNVNCVVVNPTAPAQAATDQKEV